MDYYIGTFLCIGVFFFIILVHLYRRKHNIPEPPVKYSRFRDESLFSGMSAEDSYSYMRTNPTFSHLPFNIWYGLDDEQHRIYLWDK